MKNFMLFGAALIYIVLIAWPLEYCLTRKCTGSDLDAFMPAFLFSIIGIPAVISAVFIILKTLWPGSTFGPRLEKAAWIALVVVVVGGCICLSFKSQGSQLNRSVPMTR